MLRPRQCAQYPVTMIRRTIEALGSGIAVYAIMAACSSEGGPSLPQMLGLDAGSDSSVKVSDAGAHRDASTQTSRDATVPVRPAMTFPNPQMPGSMGPMNPSNPLAMVDANTALPLVDAYVHPTPHPSILDADGGRRPAQDASMTSAALLEAGTPVPEAGMLRGDSGMWGGLLDAMVHPVPDAMAEQTSGARIKIKWWTTADGLKSFAGLRDTQLNFDCTPIWVGTEHRCLPTQGASSFFRDAGCTDRAFIPFEYQSSEAPRFFTLSEVGHRTIHYTAYEFGTAIPEDVPLFTMSGDTCTVVTDATREAYAKFGAPREGHPVPLSTFALLTPTVD